MKIGTAWIVRMRRKVTLCQCHLGCGHTATRWGYDNNYREVPVADGHGRRGEEGS